MKHRLTQQREAPSGASTTIPKFTTSAEFIKAGFKLQSNAWWTSPEFPGFETQMDDRGSLKIRDTKTNTVTATVGNILSFQNFLQNFRISNPTLAAG